LKAALALLSCLALLAAHTARAADLFMLDQRYGSIAFSVSHFGSFTSLGSFPRFMGRLLIDRLHPEHTKIEVQADAAAVTVPWPDGTELLRKVPRRIEDEIQHAADDRDDDPYAAGAATSHVSTGGGFYRVSFRA